MPLRAERLIKKTDSLPAHALVGVTPFLMLSPKSIKELNTKNNHTDTSLYVSLSLSDKEAF